MKIEAKNRMNPSLFSVATIMDVRQGEVKVHFDGWGSEHDYWCSSASYDIHPPMWSVKTLKQKVQGPKGQ